MDERPDRWDIHREAPGSESPGDTPACVEFIFGSGRSERYTEEELREKIAAEGRAADDPFVKAYEELTA